MGVVVGDGTGWGGIADGADLLRGVLAAQRFRAVRAAWLERGRPLLEQLPTLIHGEPIGAMVESSSSPLLPILEEGRIETWLQPVFRSGTLGLWGYECLMRGRSPDGALVPPLTLLAWARQERLVFMLDRVVREAHLRNVGRLALPAECAVLINFLPSAIYQPEFCLTSTVRTAREVGIDPDRIFFEVVESEAVEDREHLRAILQHYRDSGFGVALDDVGSGYAGLSLLGDLRPDLIKIDRDLVQKAAGSRTHREICASLVSLGRQAGQLVLAEGVETEQQWAVMEEVGVHLMQGYLFGRPDPAPAQASLVAPRATR
jgi:EAL domain-containing protein (putative c-di-GMP-specific phosphodiesterase class I)